MRAPNLASPHFPPIGYRHMRVGEKIPKKVQSGTDGSNKMFGQPPRGEKSYTIPPRGKKRFRLTLTTILY
jgi:hypothetical protein